MKVVINIKKKHLVFGVLSLVAFGVLAFVIAQTPSPGHSSDTIWVNPISGVSTGMLLESWLSTVPCRSDGSNCRGAVVGGGHSGIASFYICENWGVATCASQYGAVQCPSGTTLRTTGAEYIGSFTNVAFYSICVRN